MSQYIHHVPGRLRVRSSAFRCPSAKAEKARAQLLGTAGVRQVTLNPRAGSITVHYDPARIRQSELLGTLHDLGCLAGAARTGQGQGAPSAVELFGKAVAAVVMQKAMEQSARTLVGAFI